MSILREASGAEPGCVLSTGGTTVESFPRLCFDRGVAVLALLLWLPVSAAIGIAIWLEDGRPILFRQTRIGRGGRPFRLVKFRSMYNHRGGPDVTSSGDRRITRIGRFLRRYKLDEVPQLWNVLVGDMNLVGPRPEVPAYVEMSNALWKAILRVRPGLTDLATLLYRDEELILAGYADPERAYREAILPAKLGLNLEYLAKRSFARDLRLLALTVVYSLLPGMFNPSRARRLILFED
ncbi:MAG: sugar transferase [Candidatus Solibacter sp.]